MPDMPEPPMPTKCSDLTLCRMGELLAEVGTAARRIGLAERTGPARHVEELRAVEAAEDGRELRGRGLELFHRDARLAIGEEGGVRGLLVGDEERKRKEERGDTGCGDLRHGDGTRAAHEHVAPGV